MATTVEKLRELRRKSAKKHAEIVRQYYDEVNAHARGEPLPYMITGDMYFVGPDGHVERIDPREFVLRENEHTSWRSRNQKSK